MYSIACSQAPVLCYYKYSIADPDTLEFFSARYICFPPAAMGRSDRRIMIGGHHGISPFMASIAYHMGVSI